MNRLVTGVLPSVLPRNVCQYKTKEEVVRKVFASCLLRYFYHRRDFYLFFNRIGREFSTMTPDYGNTLLWFTRCFGKFSSICQKHLGKPPSSCKPGVSSLRRQGNFILYCKGHFHWKICGKPII